MIVIAPTLCVVALFWTLRPLLKMTQSVTNCMPTRSAGTIITSSAGFRSGADDAAVFAGDHHH
ncbi:hypothetical protein CU665_10640 [Pseudomonas syringae pv. actinidifoliorum]|nr:hypothetical protein [Pseudomonas syringae pv. actinidifoliorum]